MPKKLFIASYTHRMAPSSNDSILLYIENKEIIFRNQHKIDLLQAKDREKKNAFSLRAINKSHDIKRLSIILKILPKR